jgi:hypothetical protein
VTRASLVVSFAISAISAIGPADCGDLMGKGKGGPTATQEPPPPPPPPPSSATAPPIWTPPETASTTPAPHPSSSPDFDKAKAAFEANDYKKVRAILERKVKTGKGTNEEARMLFDACTALRDKPCLAEIKAKYPNVSKTAEADLDPGPKTSDSGGKM